LGETTHNIMVTSGVGSQALDCDPTGEHALRHIVVDTLEISHDYGYTWTAVTTLPSASIRNGIVLNMGDELSWLVCYNDIYASPAPTLNIRRTIDGGVTWIDCIGNLFAQGVDTDAYAGVVRYA